jgi:capsular exopolysaccharide synthesis family protein
MKDESSQSNGPGAVNSDAWLDLPAHVDAPTARPSTPVTRSQSAWLNRTARLVGSRDIPPVSLEQYRRLAAVLHQAQVDRGIKTVMIASAFSGEGKSLTSANLALTLSESFRRRVLLVDADLRRPNLHDVFQIPNLEGLSDGLKSKSVRKMPLVEITPTLALLPGGRPDPDPVGGLTSERMKHVLQQASERFDWVILDTPPVVLLPDGNLLAAMIDTVLLVVAAGRTPCGAVERAVAAIGRDRIIGTVLNFVDAKGVTPEMQAYDYHRRPYGVSAGGPPAGALEDGR